jgi:hypothetical protein
MVVPWPDYPADVTPHLLDDLGILTQRAQVFLSEHARLGSPDQHEVHREWYECTDLDGSPTEGPAGGLERLQAFVAHCGGLTFCQERPGCAGKHLQTYHFDSTVQSGWARTGTDDWIAEVGVLEGWPLTLDWSTGRIGIHIYAPETWIANSLVNLVESAALGQSLYPGTGWQKAVMRGHGPSWGLEAESMDRLRGEVPEVAEASSPWNHWLMDDDVAVHGWRATYEPARQVAVMAWYRNREGRRRIESAVGPLADP